MKAKLYVQEEIINERGLEYFKDKTRDDFSNDKVGDGDIIDGMKISVDDMYNVHLSTLDNEDEDGTYIPVKDGKEDY